MSTVREIERDTRPFDKLPEKQQAFVEHVANGMPRAEAYTAAGFAGSGYSRNANARRLAMKLMNHIEKRIIDRIGDHAPKAIDTIKELMLNARSEQVKLKAAERLLNMAGYEKPQQLEVTTKTEEMSGSELDKQIASLIGQTGAAQALKVVNGGKSD